MVLLAAASSYAVSGAILSLGGNAQKITGSFLLTVNPSSTILSQGTSAQSTVSLMSVNGFSGYVVLSTAFTNQSLLSVFSNNTVWVPLDGTATVAMTVTVPTNATTGGYGLIVTGTRTNAKKVMTSSAIESVLVTTIADFDIQANPSLIINTAGTTNSTRVVLGSLNGFSGTVSLSVTTPFGFIGVMGGQNPVSLVPGGSGSATLQITTTKDTQPGTYDVTVTGTSGSRHHSSVLMVRVLDPVVETLALVSFRFNSPTNLTLYLQNGGNTPVTLRQYSVRDSIADAWILSSWPGPTIAPNSIGSANILIGSGCTDCTYTGIFGLFQEFVTGKTYTIQVTTTANNQFAFTVTR